MRPFKQLQHVLLSGALAAGTGMSATAGAGTLPDSPLFLGSEVPPLGMLTVARNHKLYFEAYDDASDINGDGVLDTDYKPAEIDYYGYFASDRCYQYEDDDDLFVVSSQVDNDSTKTCSGGSEWSGDFLNYLTMSRLDALRTTLYGGKRVVDEDDETVLERAYIPQDAHSWGKEFANSDDYDIADYTPLSAPSGNTRHLFASTNPSGSGGVDEDDPPDPLLRYVTDIDNRIWNWVSKERPVADERLVNPSQDIGDELTDLRVRVEVCTTPLDEDGDGTAAEYEDFCRRYVDSDGDVSWKPGGLLHEFGESGEMRFGLLTGSFEKNYSGGVLRRQISDFAAEINPETGQFDDSVDGIVHTLDALHTIRFNTPGSSNFQYACGFEFDQQRAEGECQNWGNPIAEMMYETRRYFAGKASPTSAFDPGSNSNGADTLDLPSPEWNDPYSAANGAPECARPFELVLSDTRPTFDSDDLPGSPFGGFSGDSEFNGNTLDVSDEGRAIWEQEVAEGAINSPAFVGETTTNSDGAPTAKSTSSFATLRGLSPEEPTKEGSYNAASVALFGRTNDLNPRSSDQEVDTYSVALSSPLPEIRIPVGSGSNERIVTISPFAKSVGSTRGDNRNIDSSEGAFQATNAIVDFYVAEFENLEPGSGGLASARFRINFEDSEMGTDFDQDAIVLYEIEETSSGTLDITLTSETAAGDVNQHIGYVIRGTTQDGIYLEVRDEDTSAGADDDYFLDTPPGQVPPAQVWNDGDALPLTTTRTFSVGGVNPASFPNDPLWYAAKYGGFVDGNDNDIPDVQTEWDEDGDGVPDTYFQVNDFGELRAQIASAFNEVLARVGSASAVSINSTRLDSSTVAYQATFNSSNWEGDLKALEFEDDGTLDNANPLWEARKQLPDENSRTIWTRHNGSDLEFEWSELNSSAGFTTDHPALTQDVIEWIRGDRSEEKQNGGVLRDRRDERLLGDIVDSAPQFVGGQDLRFSGLASGQGGATYADFLTNTKRPRDEIVYVGANDGMLHAFDAETGEERFAYVPEAVHDDLAALAAPSYGHRYYVNGSPQAGDAYIDPAGAGSPSWHTVLAGSFAHGARGIYALDVTNPAAFDGDSPALWEMTPESLAAAGNSGAADDLGYVLGDVEIALTENDEWVAIFGNGYNSDSGDSTLFIVDLATGELLSAIDTNSGGGGLGSPFLFDADRDRKVDYVFAGDLEGNVWKFDLETDQDAETRVVDTEDASNSKSPLFVAVGPDGDRQPITTRPAVGAPPDGQTGAMVYVGTGQYDFVGDSDVGSDPQVQSVYGVHDDFSGDPVPAESSGTGSNRYGNLVSQAIVDQFDATFDGESFTLRELTDNDVDYTGANTGWVLDLKVNGEPARGERVIARPTLRFDRLILSTFIPSDSPCEFGGESFLLEFNAINGSRFEDPIFDLNNDGNIDSSDLPTDGDGNPIYISGVQTAATTNPPAIISGSQDGAGGGNGGSGGGGSPCQEQKVFSTLAGGQEVVSETCDALGLGRQSWRQIR